MTDDPTDIEMNIAYYRDRLKQNLHREQRLAVEQLLAEAGRRLVVVMDAAEPISP
jgi:hypothetical protein